MVKVLFDKYVTTENVFLYINDKKTKETRDPRIDVQINNKNDWPNSKFNHVGPPLYKEIHRDINAILL